MQLIYGRSLVAGALEYADPRRARTIAESVLADLGPEHDPVNDRGAASELRALLARLDARNP